MEEHSRPTTFGDLKALIPALNQKDAQYLLISDHALFAHGYHRATTNIDPLVLASNAAGESIRVMDAKPVTVRARTILRRPPGCYRWVPLTL